MKSVFYDVKARQKVELEVTDKQEFQTKSGKRYAIKAKTADGRTVMKFVSMDDYNKAQV